MEIYGDQHESKIIRSLARIRCQKGKKGAKQVFTFGDKVIGIARQMPLYHAKPHTAHDHKGDSFGRHIAAKITRLLTVLYNLQVE